MNKEERKKYVFAQLNSLPNAFQYVEVTNYINSLKNENTNLKQAIAKIKDKLLCYGETFDSDIHQQFQKECLQIINEVNIDE